MGKDDTDLFTGDGEWDIEIDLIERGFGLEYFYRDDNLDLYTRIHLTKDLINNRLTDVLKKLSLDVKDLKMDSSIACYLHYLGRIIMKTGAYLPDDLREKIAESATPEKDGYTWYKMEFEEERKILLKDLRDKILNNQEGQIILLLEDGGKPFKIPNIVIEWVDIKRLLIMGCSLNRISELLDKKYDNKITPQIILENLEYYEPLSAIFDQTFRNVRISVLKDLTKQFFNSIFFNRITTPKEMSKLFISEINPEGIADDELEELVKDMYEVDSWEDARILTSGTDTEKFELCELYEKKEEEELIKFWNRLKSYLIKVNRSIIKIINDRWLFEQYNSIKFKKIHYSHGHGKKSIVHKLMGDLEEIHYHLKNENDKDYNLKLRRQLYSEFKEIHDSFGWPVDNDL